MTLRNAFDNLATESNIVRLNYIVGALKNFVTAVDPVTGQVRTQVLNSITVGTLPTLGAVTTVTTVSTVTNMSQLGGLGANSLVVDSMNNRWAAVVRGRIT